MATNRACLELVTDENECDTAPCNINANCVNTVGSFTCQCKTGYQTDNNTATDTTIVLDDYTDYNYDTVLLQDYTGNNTADNTVNCIDINECASSDNNNCHNNATCTNTDGSFSCACDTGYDGNGVNCTDIDECVSIDDNGNSIHNCHNNATCTNTDGSFSCACDTGYAGNGVNCTDIDECVTVDADGNLLHNCHINATCTNTDGSFSCACDTGYNGNGVNCTDIDECAFDYDYYYLGNDGYYYYSGDNWSGYDGDYHYSGDNGSGQGFRRCLGSKFKAQISN